MRTWALFFVTIVFVVVTSALSVNLWGEKEEGSAENIHLKMTSAMTVAEFGEINALSRPLLKEIFNLVSPDQLQKPITGFGMSLQQISTQVNKKHALAAEDASKNWFKIPLKFALWLLFMIVCLMLLVKKKINKKTRIILYLSGFTVFGIILGPDPNPMGTIKDAIVLYASKGVIFKPRMIAFTVFSLTVVLANKFICSWGCQMGTLQDFMFRLNRNAKDNSQGFLPQYKVPFLISNTVRVIFFIALTWMAFAWSYDLTREIDPFKIFNPMQLSVSGWIFILATLFSGLFVYRPWCHLFCPFGFTGWVFEKISLFNVKVNYGKCISCHACEQACPSHVMGAILKRDKVVIPDCFSCGNCIEACPTDAVEFAFGKRGKPPAGKLEGQNPAVPGVRESKE